MGWHLFVSICLGLVGGIVCTLFGVSVGMSALVGAVIFGLYWGICLLVINTDDLF